MSRSESLPGSVTCSAAMQFQPHVWLALHHDDQSRRAILRGAGKPMPLTLTGNAADASVGQLPSGESGVKRKGFLSNWCVSHVIRAFRCNVLPMCSQSCQQSDGAPRSVLDLAASNSLASTVLRVSSMALVCELFPSYARRLPGLCCAAGTFWRCCIHSSIWLCCGCLLQIAQ